MRASGGVDLVVEVPRWSERWVLEDDVTMPESSDSDSHAAASTLAAPASSVARIVIDKAALKSTPGSGVAQATPWLRNQARHRLQPSSAASLR